jgi:hypothetical protein
MALLRVTVFKQPARLRLQTEHECMQQENV